MSIPQIQQLVIFMLEEVEMRYILTDADGKLLGCYTEIDSAELDARDMVEGRGEDYSLNIYELINAQKLGDPILQNTYELRKSFPEPEPEAEAGAISKDADDAKEPESEGEDKPEEETKAEDSSE
jgi:hypothetical protein